MAKPFPMVTTGRAASAPPMPTLAALLAAMHLDLERIAREKELAPHSRIGRYHQTVGFEDGGIAEHHLSPPNKHNGAAIAAFM